MTKKEYSIFQKIITAIMVILITITPLYELIPKLKPETFFTFGCLIVS